MNLSFCETLNIFSSSNLDLHTVHGVDRLCTTASAVCHFSHTLGSREHVGDGPLVDVVPVAHGDVRQLVFRHRRLPNACYVNIVR